MNDEARLARLAELGLLAASVGHEFRHALFTIRAAAQLARAAPGPEDAVRHLDHLLQALDHVQEVLDALAVYGRAGDGAPGPVDPGHATHLAVCLVEARARAAGVRLERRLRADLGLLRGDLAAVVQILVNLLHNAVDASPEGGRVRLEGGVAGDATAFLEVRDEGAGVPASDAERIFEPFYTTKPPGRGTGLGLWNARALAERMGGRVLLVPSEEGACLRVELGRWRPEG